MAIDWSVVKDIALPIVFLVIGAAINRAFERRTRLVTYYGHASAIRLQRTNPPMTVHTHSVVVTYAGGLAAHNVHLPHNVLPEFSVFPSINFTRQTLPGGGEEVVFPILASGQQITITYLYFPPVTYQQVNLPIYSDEGTARVLNVLPTPQPPKWALRLAFALLIVGAITTIYVAYAVVNRILL
jgi:hypothetical protein